VFTVNYTIIILPALFVIVGILILPQQQQEQQKLGNTVQQKAKSRHTIIHRPSLRSLIREK
jgi:hypothetical protein